MLDGPLVYSGRSPRLERQVSSVLMGVLSVIRAAGLGELGISPGSVRLTAARQVYDAAESHKIERAAEFLGIDNFETVARCLHLN